MTHRTTENWSSEVSAAVSLQPSFSQDVIVFIVLIVPVDLNSG